MADEQNRQQGEATTTTTDSLSGDATTTTATQQQQQQQQQQRPAEEEIRYIQYENESQLPLIMDMMAKDLSEPYSIFTYRYFINNWTQLCFLAMMGDKCVGSIVCKLDDHRGRGINRGYIAMLAVDKTVRKRGIGSGLVSRAIEAMKEMDCEEVVLETEVTNLGALALYENLGFIREKRLNGYYLNGVDAFRLKVWLK